MNERGDEHPSGPAGDVPPGSARRPIRLRPETSERILKGAVRALARQGARGTSMEDVAKEAGVTRMTVYRYFGSREMLMDQLTQRELRCYFVEALARANALESAARPGENAALQILIVCIQFTIDHFVHHPILNALMEKDPDLIHPFWVTKSDVIFGGTVLALTPMFDRWHDKGWIKPLPSAWLAEWLTRLVMSWHVQPSAVMDAHDPATVRELVELFIWPVIDPGSEQSGGA